MAESTMWWLLAGAAVAVELLTGTFYLLMLGVGMVAGALFAHAGGAIPLQLTAAAVVGGGAVAAWHLLQERRRAAAPLAQIDPVQNLDVGEIVQVAAWGPDDTALVRYRGANWTSIPADGVPRGAGAHRVRRVDGTKLVLEKI